MSSILQLPSVAASALGVPINVNSQFYLPHDTTPGLRGAGVLPPVQWRGGRGGRGARAPPQRREKMGAPSAPSILRGRQMPESLVQTKLRRDAQLWAISPSQI